MRSPEQNTDTSCNINEITTQMDIHNEVYLLTKPLNNWKQSYCNGYYLGTFLFEDIGYVS